MRSVTFGDCNQLVDLHIAAFGSRDNSREQITAYYMRLLERVLKDPRAGAPTNQSRCLVQDGKITSMLIGVPVPVTFKGRGEWAVVGTLMSTAPGRVPPKALTDMLIDFRNGPQLFSYSDRVTEPARRMALRADARTYPQHSMRWGRVIHPGNGAASALLNRKNIPRSLQRQALRGLAVSLNASSKRLFGDHVDIPPPRKTLRLRPLEPADVVDHGPAFLSDFTLRPDFSDEQSVEMQWNELELFRSEGSIHRVAVIDSKDRLAGWYLLHRWPTGTAEVIQLVSAPNMERDVIAMLLGHARDLGVGSVHGDASMSQLIHLGNVGAYFYVRTSATTVHSHDPGVHEAFGTGKAFLSGLEGEYPVMLSRAANG